MLLTLENYRHGFLVDDEVIAGVTEMAEGSAAPVFAAYVSHYLSGETYAYREFERAEDAIAFLATFPRAWAFEAVGCGSVTKKLSAGGGCTSCSSGGCGSGSC